MHLHHIWFITNPYKVTHKVFYLSCPYLESFLEKWEIRSTNNYRWFQVFPENPQCLIGLSTIPVDHRLIDPVDHYLVGPSTVLLNPTIQSTIWPIISKISKGVLNEHNQRSQHLPINTTLWRFRRWNYICAPPHNWSWLKLEKTRKLHKLSFG